MRRVPYALTALSLVSSLALLALALASCGGNAHAASNPPARYTFQCEIDGTPIAFKKVEGLAFSVGVVDVPGNVGPATKAPTTPSLMTFRLKRPYVGKPASEPILDWFRGTLSGQDVRKNISIIIKDHSGASVGRYDLQNCFLVAYSLTALDADTATECEETIEICVASSSNYLT